VDWLTLLSRVAYFIVCLSFIATTDAIIEIVANVKKATVCLHSPASTPPAKSVISVMINVKQPTMKSIQALIDARALKIGGISKPPKIMRIFYAIK